MKIYNSDSSGKFTGFTKEFIRTALIALGVLIIVLLLWPFSIVGPQDRGVKVRLGAVSETIEKPGIVIRVPLIDEIKTYSLIPQELESRIEVSRDGAITKDNQTIGASMTVYYRYREDRLLDMVKNYGEERIASIVKASIRESVKTIIGGYTIFEIATNQEKIKSQITELIKAGLSEFPVEIADVRITNFDWSDEFDKQIQETMAKAQQVKQKEQELLITELEAQKRVKEADASRQALVSQAQGEKEAASLRAEAKALEGEGIRKYNEAIERNRTLEVELRKLEIEMKRVEKWDGQYVPNNNYLPIPFNYGGIQGAQPAR